MSEVLSAGVYQYFRFLGDTLNMTPIWPVSEQPICVTTDNSSIFTPGSSTLQLCFRRSEIIVQESKNGKHSRVASQHSTSRYMQTKTDR